MTEDKPVDAPECYGMWEPPDESKCGTCPFAFRCLDAAEKEEDSK